MADRYTGTGEQRSETRGLFGSVVAGIAVLHAIRRKGTFRLEGDVKEGTGDVKEGTGDVKHATGEASSKPSERRGQLIAVSLPGLVAAGLGLVYAAGAFSKMAEVMKAGYEPALIFPLIPTEQFLSRGLAVLLDPSSLLTVFILFTSGLSNLSVREGMIKAGQHEQDDRIRRRVVGLAAVLAVPAALFAPLDLVGRLAIAGGLTFVTYTTLFWPPYVVTPTFRRRTVVVLVTFWLTSVIAGTFLSGDRPPDVRISAPPAPSQGPLLARTDDTWYIGQKTKTVGAIPASRATSAQVLPPKEANSPSLFNRLRRGRSENPSASGR